SGVPLREVMKHDEFARNYPKLMDSIKVHIKEGTPGAHYDPVTGNITISNPGELEQLAIKYKDPGLRPRSIIAHELMHAVQHVEGLPKGDNVGRHIIQLNEEADNLINHSDYLEKLLREELQKNNPDQIKVKNYRESIDRITRRELAPHVSTKIAFPEQRVEYNREQSPHLQAHEMPISEHLQKTGEMDDE